MGARAAWTTTLSEELADFSVLVSRSCAGFYSATGPPSASALTSRRWTQRVRGSGGSTTFQSCRLPGSTILPPAHGVPGRQDSASAVVIVDFHFVFQPSPCRRAACRSVAAAMRSSIHASVVCSWIVVDPIIAVCRRFPDTVYALELINEPGVVYRRRRVCSRKESGADGRDAGLHRRRRSGINRAGLRSTVGFAKHRSMKAWESPGLGLTLHQWHYYLDPRTCHKTTWLTFGPCIVGEFPSALEAVARAGRRARHPHQPSRSLERRGYDGRCCGRPTVKKKNRRTRRRLVRARA